MEKINGAFQNFWSNIKENTPSIIIGLLVLLIGFFIAKKIKNFTQNRILSNSPNAITRVFIAQIVSITIQVITIVSVLRIFGFQDLTTNLLAGAGILTFVIGFAFKDIGENFLAGILLAFKSPFKINDLIETSGIVGYVIDLTLRETRIKTLDGKDVFVPNGQIIKNPLFNYTIDGFLRYDFIIGLDYATDVSKAIQTILETVKNVEGVIDSDKRPNVSIDEFAASTINLRVQFWIDTFKSTSKTYHSGIKTEVMKRVLEDLVAKGFSLPSDIAEIKQYKG